MTRSLIVSMFFFVFGLSHVVGSELISENLDASTNQDLSMDDLLGQLDDYEKTHVSDFSLTRGPHDPKIIALALQTIKEPFWKNTKAPAGRDILYLLPHKITAVEYGGVACNLFFNMTNHMETNIKNLFELEATLKQEEFLALISEFLSSDMQPWEIDQLLPLFDKINIQERKAGLLFQSAFIKGPLTVQLNTSIQLSERNFWLNESDLDELKELLKNKFNTEGSFDMKELYKLRIGMGDTRLKIGLNTINAPSFQLDVGIESFIPTSRASYTPKVRTTNPTSFNGDLLQESFIPMIKGVRDYLINPTIGIGHWGLGAYIESKADIFHDLIQLWTRFSYNMFFERTEDRLFMYNQTLKPEDLKLITSGQIKDPTAADKMLIDYVRQYIYPSAFSSNIKPGDVANIIFAISIDLPKHNRWAVGYDFYAQREEAINGLNNTSASLQELKVEESQSPLVQQHKIFTEFLHTKPQKYGNLAYGLGGDLTVASKGIGEDWTVYFKFVASY